MKQLIPWLAVLCLICVTHALVTAQPPDGDPRPNPVEQHEGVDGLSDADVMDIERERKAEIAGQKRREPVRGRPVVGDRNTRLLRDVQDLIDENVRLRSRVRELERTADSVRVQP